MKTYFMLIALIGFSLQNTINAQDYTAQSVLLSLKEELTGKTAIKDYYKSQVSVDFKYREDSIIVAHPERKIYYSIGQFNAANKALSALRITQDKEGKRVLVLEFVAQLADADQKKIENEIDLQRKAWIKACNAHNASALIDALYCENTKYFNHKPMLKGRESLKQEYAYMNNPKYELKLLPIQLKVVNPSLVFEIGQCQGSYKGKYMLVWHLDPDGKWRILFDSNI